MFRTCSVFAITTTAFLLVALAPSAPAVETDTTYVSHAPFYINGETALRNTAIAEHWSGTGTPTDPFIIQGYDITGTAGAGIIIYSASSSFTIRDNRIHDMTVGHGIVLEYTSGTVRVESNAVTNVRSVGILVLGLHAGAITGNTVTHAGWTGIETIYGSYTVTANTVTTVGTIVGTGYGFLLSSLSASVISGNAVHGVASGSGAYVGSSTTTSVTSNAFDGVNGDGIEIGYLNDATVSVSGNVVGPGATNGVHVYDSSLLSIAGNTVHNATRGLYAERTTRATFAGNDLEGNAEGVVLDTVVGSSLHTNTLASNGVDLHVVLSRGNVVYDNRFESKNAVKLQLSPDTRWNVTKTAGTNVLGGAFLGGNAWSDYTGVDVDQDGLGDVPYGPLPYGTLPRDTVVADDYASLMPYGPYDQHPLMTMPVAAGVVTHLGLPVP